MPFKRREEPTSIDQEREALREQYAALEDLKRELAERIDAVREREIELRHALSEIEGGAAPGSRSALPARPPSSAQADDSEGDAARAKALGEREQALTAREATLAARASELERASGDRPAAEPDAERLVQIEARLAELRDSEKLFLRTREELAARSEAVAARERLVSQRERELDAREDAVGDRSGGRELTEMEERLRRLEQQQVQPATEQTLGFSGGLRKLEQGTRQQRPR